MRESDHHQDQGQGREGDVQEEEGALLVHGMEGWGLQVRFCSIWGILAFLYTCSAWAQLAGRTWRAPRTLQVQGASLRGWHVLRSRILKVPRVAGVGLSAN